MRKQLIVLSLLMHLATPAPAQVSFGFGFQSDNISISLSTYPNMVRVPGYPVYYASGLNSNYFFYDGLYWIFETDRWYSSSWYNGPWMMVDPDFIPLYLLRVPVRYYRRPPSFFMGWQGDAPPRWDQHWGNDWSQRRSGWDRWNRRAMPAPAPLPTYQRQYAGERYPTPDRQAVLHNQNYRHEARDPLVRQQSRALPAPRDLPEQDQRGRAEPVQRRGAEPPAPAQRTAPAVRPNAPQEQQQPRTREYREPQRAPQAAPRMEERPPPRNDPPPQRETNMRSRGEANPQPARPPGEGGSASRQPDHGQRQGQARERDNGDERGQGRGR